MGERHHVPGSLKDAVADVLVTVEAVDLTEDERIVVICSWGEQRQRVPILDFPLPNPTPKGAEWVEAYRAWSSGSWS